MSVVQYPDEIKIRSNAGLRQAVHAAARLSDESLSEFVRQALRRRLREMGAEVPGESSPASGGFAAVGGDNFQSGGR